MNYEINTTMTCCSLYMIDGSMFASIWMYSVSTCCWVCSLKSTHKRIMPRAKLVELCDYIQKDLPAFACESWQLIIAVSIKCHWKLHFLNIKTAFLKEQTMDGEIYHIWFDLMEYQLFIDHFLPKFNSFINV